MTEMGIPCIEKNGEKSLFLLFFRKNHFFGLTLSKSTLF